MEELFGPYTVNYIPAARLYIVIGTASTSLG